MREQICLTIDRASIEDAKTLGYIHAQSWKDAYHTLLPESFWTTFTPQTRAAFFARILASSQNEQYILRADGVSAGMLSLGAAADEDLQGTACGEIIALYLLAPYYGKGIGRKAMDFALSRLRALGYDDIVLTVLLDNDRARRFYARCGFVYDGHEEPIDLGRTLMECRYRYRA